MFHYFQRMTSVTLGMCSFFLITAGSSYGDDQQEQAFIRAFNESRANYRICQLYSEGFNGVRQHCQGDPEVASNALRKRCVAYYKLEAANKLGCREIFHKLLHQYSASSASTASEPDNSANKCVQMFINDTNRISFKNLCSQPIQIQFKGEGGCRNWCHEPLGPGQTGRSTPLKSSDSVEIRTCFGFKVAQANASGGYSCEGPE